MHDPDWRIRQELEEMARLDELRRKKLERDATVLAKYILSEDLAGMTRREARDWILAECDRREITDLGKWLRIPGGAQELWQWIRS